MEHDIDQYKKVPKTLATLAAPEFTPFFTRQTKAIETFDNEELGVMDFDGKTQQQEKHQQLEGKRGKIEEKLYYDHKTYPIQRNEIALKSWTRSLQCVKDETVGSTNRKCVTNETDDQPDVPPPTTPSPSPLSTERQSLVVSAGKWQLTCPRRRCSYSKDTECPSAVSCSGQPIALDSVYGGCLGVLTLMVTALVILFYRHTVDQAQHSCRSCPPWPAPGRISADEGQLTWSQERFREQFQLELNAAEHILAPIVQKIIRTNYKIKR